MTGFNSKRDAAADKLQEPDALTIAYQSGFYDGKKAALAQPVQEPVAWITPDGKGFRIRFSPPTNDVPLGWDALYTAPPQREWVGLTDEEIRDCLGPEAVCIPPGWSRLTRAIEAKLKEKNT